MNKAAIKNYAIWARVQLIEAAKQRAFEYEITENGENKANVDSIGGRLLSADEKEQRKQLISQIQRKGYTQVMEEAAYTWFNRFIALRFMEVNGFLPSKVRVFTDENGAFKPEILKEAMTVEIEGLDRAVILDLLDKQNNEELYKYLLITQCNALNQGLPYMFEKISNWTELLFPANLLRPDSVVGQMVSEIPEEDWQDAVQIIGWMYESYNTERNEMVYDGNLSKSRIPKELLPAATTIFTPDWPVRYMVENSLGRLWYEGHPSFDKSEWKYYLDEAPQEPEVELQLKKIRSDYASINPEDIKVIDPCIGSGHILVYAFDVLLQIYTSCGWTERDAAKSIIENNLYGLDIDDRAGQLAYFAVMMKARKYNRRILNGAVTPNVLAIQDSGFITDDFIAYVAEKDTCMKADLTLLRSSLKDAKEYGSILHMPKLNFTALYERIDIIGHSFAEDMFQISYQNTAVEQLLPLIKQAQIMAQKYDVVVTNPPYLGNTRFSAKLDSYIKSSYELAKADLSMAMYSRSINGLVKDNGFVSFITTTSWMFLSSFEKFRRDAASHVSIVSMVDFGTELFEGKVGHNPIVAWVSCKMRVDYQMRAVRLVEYCYSRRNEKQGEFFNNKNHFVSRISNFSKIPGSPIVYWLGNYSIFDSPQLGTYIDARIGMVSGNNERFLRFWYEVGYDNIEYYASPDCDPKRKKWYPLQKGGEFRHWYGNNTYVIDWENDGYALKFDNYLGDRVRSHNYNGTQQFKEGITWNSITSGAFHCRYSPVGYTFDAAGPLCEVKDRKNLYPILAFLSSKVAVYLFSLINPTINFPPGYLEVLPYIAPQSSLVEGKTKYNVAKSREDWDSFETSWDFKKHPLV